MVPSSDIKEFMSGHLTQVFDTMLSLKANPIDPIDPNQFPERVSGSVGFAGEKVTGSVYLHIPAAFATQATAAMLGMGEGETPGDDEVKDVIGEVTNMLGGGLKSWLCDAGAVCALTTPAVIRGQSFAVLTSSGVEKILLPFDCGQHRGQAEVHIKFR